MGVLVFEDSLGPLASARTQPAQGPTSQRQRKVLAHSPMHLTTDIQMCVYFCSTYYKAVRVGGGYNGGHVL